MSQDYLDIDDWQLITSRLREGTCVPFLGAGANVTSKDGKYQGLPLGGDVSLAMAELWMKIEGADLKSMTAVQQPNNIETARLKDYKDLTRVSLYNLARVALQVRVRQDYPAVMGLLRRLIPEEEREPSPLLRTLAKLPIPVKPTNPPFRLIVTTNYDRLLERALTDEGYQEDKDYRVIVQRIEGFDPKTQKKLEKELAVYQGLVVYKIHGSFGEAEKDVIVTEEDYIEFLLSVLKPKLGVPNLVKSKLVGSTLLFLGYSLEDWDFRTLFKGLIESLPDRQKLTSYAIQFEPPDFWVKFWEEKKVRIRNLDLYAFAKDLCEKLGIEIDGNSLSD